MYFIEYDLNMKLNKIIIILIFIPLINCVGIEKRKSSSKDEKIYFSSSGFALIYNDSLYKNKVINKKINNDKILLLHKTLRTNTTVRITNLKNSKSLDTKVYRKAKYPDIFNVLISKKIASILELDFENPYVEVIELKKNKIFVAKEGNTFEEERNVAEKAPVEEIEMNNIAEVQKSTEVKKEKKEKFLIIISDFYYKDSAINLKKELSSKILLKNISIKKINDTKYRLLAGPFENFNALKTTYISLNNLGFEDLNIYHE